MIKFCYLYKFVNFKGMEMSRYCIIAVELVPCSDYLMLSFYGHKVSVIFTESYESYFLFFTDAYLSKEWETMALPPIIYLSQYN